MGVVTVGARPMIELARNICGASRVPVPPAEPTVA